jgi:hypothetical protein
LAINFRKLFYKQIIGYENNNRKKKRANTANEYESKDRKKIS